jgi:hypothetical protein
LAHSQRCAESEFLTLLIVLQESFQESSEALAAVPSTSVLVNAVWMSLLDSRRRHHEETHHPLCRLLLGSAEGHRMAPGSRLMKPGVISEKNLENNLICKCGTPARKMPRCGKRRYRHKCPHGKFCEHGDRLAGAHANRNSFCEICVAHSAAIRLNADPAYLAGLISRKKIYKEIKERAEAQEKEADR